jgi:predicted glutamine amidotransferase
MVGLAAAGGGEGPESQLPVWHHLVGAPNALRTQAETGKVWPGNPPGHKDSWGVGWFDRAGRPSVIRQTGSAADSAYYVFASEVAARGGAGSGPAATVIGHLRKASCGAVNSANAHPVQVYYNGGRDSLLVAHNGTVYKPLLETLRADLADGSREEARSDSDTVVLAGWLALRVGLASAGADPFDAAAESLRELFRRGAEVTTDGELTKAYSGVNLLVAHSDGLMALRQFSHRPEYYTLFARSLTAPEDSSAAAGWVVASEPTDEDIAAWKPLTPGTLVMYPTRSGGKVRTAYVV